MKKLLLVAISGILAGSAAGWALHGATGGDPARGTPLQTRDENVTDGAQAARTVSLDPDAVKDMGLGVSILRPARHAPLVQANAVVLSPQGLSALSTSYVTDTKDLAMARANLAIARNEYQRQSVLYRQQENTSLKQLQAARGALASGQAQTLAAGRQLQLDSLNVEQSWGPVIARWLKAGSPEFEEILSQQQWLIEVTWGANDPRVPRRVRLIAPSGSVFSARLVSALPQINPVIQGLNYLYLSPVRPGLAPGLNFVAEIPSGPAQSGVIIPATAVIWSQGQAWAYQEIAPGRFQRLPVATDEPAGNGWFVTKVFNPGDKIVTRAVEELFAAEAQAASGNQGGGEEDDD